MQPFSGKVSSKYQAIDENYRADVNLLDKNCRRIERPRAYFELDPWNRNAIRGARVNGAGDYIVNVSRYAL